MTIQRKILNDKLLSEQQKKIELQKKTKYAHVYRVKEKLYYQHK